MCLVRWVAVFCSGEMLLLAVWVWVWVLAGGLFSSNICPWLRDGVAREVVLSDAWSGGIW